MSGKQYWKNKIPYVTGNFLAMAALAVFLLLGGNTTDSVLFILGSWLVILTVSMGAAYMRRRKQMDTLLESVNQLEEKYLIAEVTGLPERADDRVFYQVMKAAEKSMLEQIGNMQREQKEYREYIEQWVHEMKTPITAMKLLCENHRSEFARQFLVELEKSNRLTEQVLYYARSEHTEKDYSVRETTVFDVVHAAIADNKNLLMENHISVCVEESEASIFSDEKWIRFILNQFIANSVKYKLEKPEIRFYAKQQTDSVRLYIEDNGIGIEAADLPRIFEKGFTGVNGRKGQASTGIGLYLCRRLCEKLDIGIGAESDGNGTRMILTFRVNHFTQQVQG